MKIIKIAIVIAIIGVGLICSILLLTPSTSGSGRQQTLKQEMSYLNNLSNVSWVDVESNNVYIGLNVIPSNLRAIVNAAAYQGNKATGSGVHVWAVDSRYVNWRPGRGDPHICQATARNGKIEKSDC